MAEQGGVYRAEFVYDEAVLKDFEALYQKKKEISPAVRVVFGALGVAGAVYFALNIYREGFSITQVGYLIICSILMLVAFARTDRRPDDTIRKYRKYYLDRRASFRIDADGVELKIEGQKNYARSKFRELYGLFDTDLCLYFVIKGKAYYILPRKSVTGGSAEELMRYMEKKCGKRFQKFDVTANA